MKKNLTNNSIVKNSENQNLKTIIFDSSSIINFTINGLLEEFKELKKIFGGKFIITNDVKLEIIDRPLEIKKFKFEAMKIRELLNSGVLELPISLGINENDIHIKTVEILNTANNTFSGRSNSIKIIDAGEASCLALSLLLNEKKISNILAVDERTIRVLSEKPENLLEILRRKLHMEISSNKSNFKFFEGKYKFIRSSELIYVAYKKGIIKIKDKEVLDALLFALKLNGCAISEEEIEEMKRLG